MDPTDKDDPPRIRFGEGHKRLASEASAFRPDGRSPFPRARLIRWSPDVPAQGHYPIVVSQTVLDAINVSVSASLDYEIGGFLLGSLYVCPNEGVQYLMVDQYSPARFTEQTSVSLMFTTESWGQLAEDLEGRFRGKNLVGWYHSHPRMDVFLSQTDVDLHTLRFPKTWQVALVITPDKNKGGFFAWHDGKLDRQRPVEFYEFLEGKAPTTRESVMHWEAYTGYEQPAGASLEVPRSITVAATPSLGVIHPSSPKQMTMAAPTAGTAVPDDSFSSHKRGGTDVVLGDPPTHTVFPVRFLYKLFMLVGVGFLLIWIALTFSERSGKWAQRAACIFKNCPQPIGGAEPPPPAKEVTVQTATGSPLDKLALEPVQPIDVVRPDAVVQIPYVLPRGTVVKVEIDGRMAEIHNEEGAPSMARLPLVALSGRIRDAMVSRPTDPYIELQVKFMSPAQGGSFFTKDFPVNVPLTPLKLQGSTESTKATGVITFSLPDSVLLPIIPLGVMVGNVAIPANLSGRTLSAKVPMATVGSFTLPLVSMAAEMKGVQVGVLNYNVVKSAVKRTGQVTSNGTAVLPGDKLTDPQSKTDDETKEVGRQNSSKTTGKGASKQVNPKQTPESPEHKPDQKSNPVLPESAPLSRALIKKLELAIKHVEQCPDDDGICLTAAHENAKQTLLSVGLNKEQAKELNALSVPSAKKKETTQTPEGSTGTQEG